MRIPVHLVLGLLYQPTAGARFKGNLAAKTPSAMAALHARQTANGSSPTATPAASHVSTIPPAFTSNVIGYYSDHMNGSNTVWSSLNFPSPVWYSTSSGSFYRWCSMAGRNVTFNSTFTVSSSTITSFYVSTSFTSTPCQLWTGCFNGFLVGTGLTSFWCGTTDFLCTTYRYYHTYGDGNVPATESATTSINCHVTTSGASTDSWLWQVSPPATGLKPLNTAKFSTAPKPSTSPDSAGKSSSSSAGGIAGGVVGGLAGLAIVVILLWYLRKKHKKNAASRKESITVPAEEGDQKNAGGVEEVDGEVKLNELPNGIEQQVFEAPEILAEAPGDIPSRELEAGKVSGV